MDGEDGNEISEEERDSGDYLISCMHITWFFGELEDLKVMVGHFVWICRRSEI